MPNHNYFEFAIPKNRKPNFRMLAKEAFEKEGRHTGSLIAILNILPVVDELAKKIY